MKPEELSMQFRLILLYVFDKMEVPLTADTVLHMCSVDNAWVPYMDCQNTLLSLVDAGFLCEKAPINGKMSYIMTSEGRLCLSFFFTRIPSTTRDNILEYIKNNRIAYKKFQEYFSDYQKNADGTYSVTLKIEASPTLLELKMNTDSKENAEYMYKNWRKKAAAIYESLYDILME